MKKTTGLDRNKTKTWHPATQAVRGGTWRSEHGETSEALFLTSGYTYDSAEEVAARFAGEAQGMTYSRLQNPTVAMLEERIALMEGAEACRTQAIGRVRRYGQLKTVRVYDFLAEDTIDTEVWAERTRPDGAAAPAAAPLVPTPTPPSPQRTARGNRDAILAAAERRSRQQNAGS